MRGPLLVAGSLVLSVIGVSSATQLKAPADDAELLRLMKEDQADRQPKVIEWSVVTPRDRTRLARVKQLYADGRVRTGADYYHAALVLQHGERAEDYLLAHEFCVAAMMLGKSDIESASLGAAAEDRFLMTIGRAQRFGTQYRADGKGPMQLYRVEPGVSDELRRLMAVPPLSEAKARATGLTN